MSPLILLVGFLGSGKTTFLRQLLPELKKQGLTPHVVINDYQNARVDATWLQEVTEFVKPISGSCVCCESSEELLETFAEIPLTATSVLLVETNGTTDAEELIERLTLDRRVHRFMLPWQVNLVDAKRWQNRFWHNGLERDQFKTATHFYLSRQEESKPERVTLIKKQLQEINPAAVESSPLVLGQEIKKLVESMETLVPRVMAQKSAHSHDHDHHEDHDHNHESDHDHHHDHGEGHEHHHQAERHHFASAELILPGAVMREAFVSFLKKLPREVLRAKGLVVLRDSMETTHVFQRVEADEEVIFVPLREPSPLPPVLVLVGVDLPIDSLQAQIANLR